MSSASNRRAAPRSYRRNPASGRRAPAYRSAARRTLADAFEADHVEHGRFGRFRWLLSTLLAAGVGAVAIAAVILASLDSLERPTDGMPSLKDISTARPAPAITQSGDGLKWDAPKVDRLAVASSGTSTKQVVQEQVQVKRDNRAFIDNRNYVRISARLAQVSAKAADAIPAFNPLKLYAPVESSAQEDGSAGEQSVIVLQVADILGGVLPIEDGQEIDGAEIQQIAIRLVEADQDGLTIRSTFVAEGGTEILTPRDTTADRQARRKLEKGEPATASNTTVLTKSTSEREDADDIERAEIKIIKVKRGDTLMGIMQRLGADTYLAKNLAAAASSLLPDLQLPINSEVHVTMVPSLQRSGRVEPGAYSVYAEGGVHKASVVRDSTGELVASQSPAAARLAAGRAEDPNATQTSSVYASVYSSALVQGVDADTIQLILRIHAPETDFRRAVRPGDAVDFFFDVREDPGPEPQPGDLLFTSLTAGGETQRFWRFRTPDGVVDYYDEYGNNSRKFLLRRPVRGENVNFSSGFGLRKHPLLNTYRPHNGIDWSTTTGTPIIAAGNGVVEEARYKGEYGNHVRLRHANGYQTTYNHMSRYGPGIREGVTVRQGQIIGFVGNTGLSAGPHLHFEVLVNNRFVDPMKIQVPRERRLTGKIATEFQRERQRIEDLMRRPPVLTVTK